MKRSRPKSKHRRYYADECFPVPSVSYLKSKSFSIVHTGDMGYINISDLEQLKVSKKLGRVLVTLDKKDFQQRKKHNLSRHPGVIVLRASSLTYPNINKLAEKVLKRVHRIKLEEALLHASTTKIRRYKKGKKDIIPWKK